MSEQGAPVIRRLRPIRVVLAGGDRRFQRVARALLVRHGYEVEASQKSSDLIGLAVRRRPCVVVLEAGESMTTAVRVAGALQALNPPIGVVIACDGDEVASRLPGLETAPKWGRVERLVNSIERAYALRANRSADGGGVAVR